VRNFLTAFGEYSPGSSGMKYVRTRLGRSNRRHGAARSTLCTAVVDDDADGQRLGRNDQSNGVCAKPIDIFSIQADRLVGPINDQHGYPCRFA
jgi:hypothetical protein